MPVSTGVLTHRFFSFRKKTARSCPRGGIGRLVTIFGSLFWHFFELLKNKVLTWSGVGPSKSGRSGDFWCCSQGRIHQFRRLRAPAVHGVSSKWVHLKQSLNDLGSTESKSEPQMAKLRKMATSGTVFSDIWILGFLASTNLDYSIS